MKRDSLHHDVRKRLQRYTTEHQSHYGVVPAPPCEDPVRLLESGRLVDQAMVALGRMSVKSDKGIMSFLRSRILSRQEALSSSGMEGTQSTLDAVLGLDSDSSADTSARSVRAYAMALDSLIPRARLTGSDIFNKDLFQEIHARVMEGDPNYKDTPGHFRKRVVWLGGVGQDISYSTWNPPDPVHVEACLEESVTYMRASGPFVLSQPLLLRLAISHAHFEAVHPFLDGNGRVGRLLIPLMMAAEGYEPVYISPWIEANRSTYYEALKQAQQQLNHAPLTAALATGIIETEKELQASEVALNTLASLWRGSDKFRNGSSADRLLDILPWLPVLSVSTACDALKVTPKAAGDGIDDLCKKGILREITGQRRNRLFEAPDVMRIISRPFGVEPRLPGDDEPSDDDDLGWK